MTNAELADLATNADAEKREDAARLKRADATAHGTFISKPDVEKTHTPRLPLGAAERKSLPLMTGVLDYFIDALCAIAAVSVAGNEQHNPGEELHWARGKSTDQADTIVRHLADRGLIDSDGHRHSAKAAWRTLALLQLEIEEAEGKTPPRGCR